jgi:hypothetical protein
MMPFWMTIVGKNYLKSARVSIPMIRLVSNLLITIIPCLIGLGISFKWPKAKAVLIKFIKKLLIIMIIFFLGITIISKFYIFKLISWKQWVAGPLIPWSGFLLGATLAYLSKRNIKVIMIHSNFCY